MKKSQKKQKPKLLESCWCGKSFATSNGLRVHKSRAYHYMTPEEKAERERRRLHAEQESKQHTDTYIEEVSEKLSNGRHLKLGDRVKIERVGIIKSITYFGEENQTVSVNIDIIKRTYKHIPHEEETTRG